VPLLIAIRAHNTAVVEALLKHDADPNETDVTGRSALEIAQERHYTDIVDLLAASGAQ